MNKKKLLTLLGERLEIARVNKDLTQGELAEKIGMSRMRYHSYESKGVPPSIVTIVKLAEVLGVTVAWLIDEGDDAFFAIDSIKPNLLIDKLYPKLSEIGKDILDHSNKLDLLIKAREKRP